MHYFVKLCRASPFKEFALKLYKLRGGGQISPYTQELVQENRREFSGTKKPVQNNLDIWEMLLCGKVCCMHGGSFAIVEYVEHKHWIQPSSTALNLFSADNSRFSFKQAATLSLREKEKVSVKTRNRTEHTHWSQIIRGPQTYKKGTRSTAPTRNRDLIFIRCSRSDSGHLLRQR